jgi:diguanylate cyclase (GGDEF)-like protein/PAS domain S-box-containing protein
MTMVPGACLALSTDGEIIAANAAAGRLYGITPLRLATMSEAELLAPGAESMLGHEAQVLRAGLAFDAVHKSAEGACLPVRVNARLSEVGGRDVIIATVLDDCVPADPEIEHIRAVAFDSALDVIIVHDLQGNLLHFNRAAAEWVGMTPEAFARIGPWGWSPPEAAGMRAERIQRLIDEESAIFEGSRRLADGSAVEYEVHARLFTVRGRSAIVAVTRDITERRRAEEAVRNLAYLDMLTGLANRALLSDRAEQAMAEANRHGDLLGLAFVDIDDFKQINDELGHSGGDAVLTATAERLVSAVRVGDTVARFGGDEFVVLLPRIANVSDLARVGAKLSSAVNKQLRVADRTVSITSSMGLSVYDPHEDGLSSLLSKADIAMYSAKRSGEPWRIFGEDFALS